MVTPKASYCTETFVCTCASDNHSRAECYSEPDQTVSFEMEVGWEPETSIFDKRMTQIQLVQRMPSFQQLRHEQETDECIVSRLDINLANYFAIPKKSSEEFFRLDSSVIVAMELKCCLLQDKEKSKRSERSSMRRVWSFVSPSHGDHKNASSGDAAYSSSSCYSSSSFLSADKTFDQMRSLKTDKYMKLQRFWSKWSNYPHHNESRLAIHDVNNNHRKNNDMSDTCITEQVLSTEDCSSDELSSTVPKRPCKALHLLYVLGGYADKSETSVEERLLVQKVKRYCPSLQRVVQQYLQQCSYFAEYASSSVDDWTASHDNGGVESIPNCMHCLSWSSSRQQQQQQQPIPSHWNTHELVQQLVETKIALAEALEQLDFIRNGRRCS